MKSLGVIICLWVSVIAQGPELCTLPSGEQGSCVLWNACSPYKEHINAGMDKPESGEFLRRRICRYDPPDAWLCCPSVENTHPQAATSKFPSPVTPPGEDECGLPPRRNTINEPGAWPWLALIGSTQVTGSFLPACAGALITRRHVLTAASCFPSDLDIAYLLKKITGNNLQRVLYVRLGEYRIQDDRTGERPQDYRILLLNTDRYNAVTRENDIIILPLDRDVVFTGSRETSTVPIAASVPVVSQLTCAQSYKRLDINIDDRQICAGDGDTDACSGDGGAPLNYYSPEKDRYYVMGLVSFGVGCAHPEYPGVYTRVSSFQEWIKKSLNWD
ncbi:venom protease-like isoform X2 [Macrobrachium nipponense]|uniref:venom protease-like isoform X2 n=1 Tax=Macrobrachium nipponense TaxID=159736 RepID=UPI0030C86795